jgi:hypothetical protein
MFVTPFVAALLIGSFWTGVGTAAIVGHNGGPFDHSPRSDVVITAEPGGHDTACSARYRSYNADTGQYLSKRDGQWHDCML